jgi:hypothetical protein
MKNEDVVKRLLKDYQESYLNFAKIRNQAIRFPVEKVFAKWANYYTAFMDKEHINGVELPKYKDIRHIPSEDKFFIATHPFQTRHLWDFRIDRTHIKQKGSSTSSTMSRLPPKSVPSCRSIGSSLSPSSTPLIWLSMAHCATLPHSLQETSLSWYYPREFLKPRTTRKLKHMKYAIYLVQRL